LIILKLFLSIKNRKSNVMFSGRKDSIVMDLIKKVFDLYVKKAIKNINISKVNLTYHKKENGISQKIIIDTKTIRPFSNKDKMYSFFDISKLKDIL